MPRMKRCLCPGKHLSRHPPWAWNKPSGRETMAADLRRQGHAPAILDARCAKKTGNPQRIAGILNAPGSKPSGQNRYLPAPEVHTVTFGSSHRRTRHAGPVLEPTFSRTVPPRPFRGIPEMRRPGCARFRTRRKGGAPRQPCRPRFPWAAAAHTGCGCIL